MDNRTDRQLYEDAVELMEEAVVSFCSGLTQEQRERLAAYADYDMIVDAANRTYMENR